jgi:hypothetical protein
VRALPVILVLAGCGSSWDLREGAEGPPLECESLLNYYVDADGDGWGDPGTADEPATPLPLCQPDEGANRTATNAMDCDDADENIGPDAGACPQSVGDDVVPVERVGLVRGTSEYLFFLATGDALERGQVEETAAEAEDWCASWAGEPTESAPEGDRGLAVLTDPAEVAEVNDALDEAIGLIQGGDTACSGTETGCVAFFVGMRWEGTLPADCDDPSFDGGWVWDDGQGPTGDIPFCDNVEPTPQDFMIGGRLCDPSLDSEAIVEQLRLALVRRDQGWCLGPAPFQPGIGNLEEGISLGNHPDSAFFACERPVFDPANYVDVPEAGAREEK